MENQSQDFQNIQRINRAQDEIRHLSASIPDYPDTGWLTEFEDHEAKKQRRDRRLIQSLVALVAFNGLLWCIGGIAILAALNSYPEMAENLGSYLVNDLKSEGPPVPLVAVVGVLVLSSSVMLIVVLSWAGLPGHRRAARD